MTTQPATTWTAEELIKTAKNLCAGRVGGNTEYVTGIGEFLTELEVFPESSMAAEVISGTGLTVGELIEQLKRVDPNQVALVWTDGDHHSVRGVTPYNTEEKPGGINPASIDLNHR